MAVNQRYLLIVPLIAVLFLLAGCGGGGSVSFPPPQGGFTNASLSGPFAFSYTGTDSSGFISAAGSFQADGNGNITTGMEDLRNAAGVATNAAITGTYTVRADGRGTANLNSSAGNTVLDFVLVASGHALVTRFDANATASGTMDQQTPSAFTNASLAGSFAFTLGGIDAVGNPLAVGGVFTSDANGNITGIDDSNDVGNVVTNDVLSGTIPVAANGRGAATITLQATALTFAFYVVDSTHIKLVQVDASSALGGDAFRQTGPFSNATLNGSFAFTLAGADNLAAAPFATGGILTADGAGNITSGAQDFNDGGSLATNIGVTGTYSIAASGRGTLTIVTTMGTFTFAIYPSSGGVLILETDVAFLTSGTALQQTPPFSAASFSGGYGMNFTGASSGGEFDSIAQFTADGASKLTGIIDVNNAGGLSFGQTLTGTFTVTSTGRSTVPLQTPLGTQNMVFYSVNGTRALFIELDNNVVAAGEIRHQ